MSLQPTQESRSDDPCGASGDRRRFLRDGLMAVAVLTALGATADRLEALTRSYAVGVLRGTELRFPIPAADGATIDAANQVIIARYQGAVHAFVLECPHRGTDVQWQGDRGRFYCPKHKSTFRPEGSLIAGKAERGLDRYPAQTHSSHEIFHTLPKLQPLFLVGKPLLLPLS